MRLARKLVEGATQRLQPRGLVTTVHVASKASSVERFSACGKTLAGSCRPRDDRDVLAHAEAEERVAKRVP